ncbi:MAG: hypothetical protein AB1529_07975 [Candidatus Micrarchaeota archaeon]
MAAAQMRKPEEQVKTASSQPQETFYSGNRSVTVRFDISGPEDAVRYFLNAVVHTRNLESLQFFVEHYGPRLERFTARVGNELVTDMSQIVPAIQRRLRE